MKQRLLPQSPEGERALLGSILLLPSEVMPKCIEAGITKAHFHIPAHAITYDVLLEFYNDNEPIDLVTITKVLQDRNLLIRTGGAHDLAALFVEVPSQMNVESYIKIIRDKHTLRSVIIDFDALKERAFDDQEDVRGLLTEAERALLKIVKAAEGQKIHSRDMRELVHRAMDRLDAAIEGDGTIAMPTGIHDLDFTTQGFRAPEVTVIIGKPSDGKTACCLNIAENLALNHGKRVGIISLEMSDDQLTDRLLASVSWTNIRDIKRKREMSDAEAQRITKASARIADAKIFIRDDGQLSMSEISATFAAWKSKHGLDFGIIDHAQLARGDGKTDGRTEEVEQISRALKPLAKRLEIPLLVLSQASGDKTQGYRTKNSSALAEDADNLWTISHVHDEHGKLIKSEIHISKQRDGERNVPIQVVWLPHFQRFTDCARQEESEEQQELPQAAKGKLK